MAFGNTITVVGNTTRDPELRFTPSGTAKCTFGLAWNNRYERNGEQMEDVSFFDVICWSSLAENVADSITRGARVVVFGRLDQQTWEDQDGTKRNKVAIRADDVAPSLRWATAEVVKRSRTGNGSSNQNQPGAQANPARTRTANQYPNEEPF